MENGPSAKASIEYLASVLGVTSFMVPEGTAIEPQPEASVVQPVAVEAALPTDVKSEGALDSRLVFVANLESLDANGRDLFERMVKAMKREPGDVMLVSLDLGQGPHALEIIASQPRSAVVVYGLEAAERLAVDEAWFLARWNEPVAGVPVIVTHSLQDILARPELKKVVWQHLQMAMQRLG